MNHHTMTTILAVVTLTAGCGGDTGRGRTDIGLEITGSSPTAIENIYGFEVIVEEAVLSVDAVEFFEGSPLFSRSWWPIVLVRSAHAHPGHYEPGEALADVLGPFVIDLMDAPASVFGNGVTGDYRSAQIRLRPTPELDGASVRIGGVARRDGLETRFVGQLVLDETIEGIAAGFVVNESQVAISLNIDMQAWLSRIDFSQLMVDGSFTVDTQPYSALLRGVRNTSAYRFEMEEE